MNKETIFSQKAPDAIGPYSQAIKCGNMLFISGQLPVDKETGVMPLDIKLQTKQSLENIKHIIAAAGYSMKDIVKGDVAKDRYIELIEIIKQKNYEFRQNIKNNKVKLEVLVEQEKNGKYLGFDQFFNQVEISSNEDLVSDWLNLEDYEVEFNKNEARFK